MNNEHGYFEYRGLVAQKKSEMGISTNATLQHWSDIRQMKFDTTPLNVASFEQNEYDTENPKILYRDDKHDEYGWTSAEQARWRRGMGFVTTEASDENGLLQSKVHIKAEFDDYYTFYGITLRTMNERTIPKIKVTGYDKSGNVVVEQNVNLSEAHAIQYPKLNIFENQLVYNVKFDTVKSVVVEFDEIYEPHHFLWITKIDYGEISIFDDTKIVDVELNNFVSVSGETLEYDTADISIFAPTGNEHLFLEKQVLVHYKGFEENGIEKTQETYYIDNGVSNGDGTMSITAYSATSLLETTFYGGMYTNYSLSSLIADILDGTGLLYDFTDMPDIKMNGWLPMSSRRTALKTVLLASNIRCFQNEYQRLIFKPIAKELNALVLDETNVVANPQIIEKKPVDEVKIKHHSYKKKTSDDDMVEVFNGELDRFTETLITFNNPVHWLIAYEIVGTDENGNDILSSNSINNTEKFNLTMFTTDACKVWYTGIEKVAIFVKEYEVMDYWFVKQRDNLAKNNVYDKIEIDLPIKADLNAVATELMDLYSRPKSIRFLTTEELEIGGCYNILGNKLNIKSIRNSFNGLYEVEAV